MTIEVGGTYWLVTRERLRAGKGPRKVKVTELVYTTSAGVRSATGAWCGKNYVSARELHADKKIAADAAISIVEAEWAAERDRHRKVIERLHSAWRAARES
jgi:hypothetical protein